MSVPPSRVSSFAAGGSPSRGAGAGALSTRSICTERSSCRDASPGHSVRWRPPACPLLRLVIRYLALSVSFGHRLLARFPSGRGPVAVNLFLVTSGPRPSRCCALLVCRTLRISCETPGARMRTRRASAARGFRLLHPRVRRRRDSRTMTAPASLCLRQIVRLILTTVCALARIEGVVRRMTRPRARHGCDAPLS
jgi:hypothetical protein